MNALDRFMEFAERKIKLWHMVGYILLLLAYDFLVFSEENEILKKIAVAVLLVVFVYFGMYWVQSGQIKNPLMPQKVVKVSAEILFYLGLLYAIFGVVHHLTQGFAPAAFVFPGISMAMLKVRRKVIEEETRKNVLSQKELEHYIRREISAKLGEVAWKQISFIEGRANSAEGVYVFEKNMQYHILFTEKGQVREDIVTTEKEEVLWQVVNFFAADMALEYAKKHREEGKDFRRALFQKEIEICALFGEAFEHRRIREVEDILKEHPYVDWNIEIVNAFFEKMLTFLPSTRKEYEEHIRKYNERLDTVVVEDIFMPKIISVIKEESNKELLTNLFAYFEEVANSSDKYFLNLFSVTIMETLGNDKEILKKAQKYMGIKTMQLQIEADKDLGRV